MKIELEKILGCLVSQDTANVELALNFMLTQLDRETLLEIVKDICAYLVDQHQVGEIIDYIEYGIIPSKEVIETISHNAELTDKGLQLVVQTPKHLSFIGGYSKILEKVYYYTVPENNFDYTNFLKLKRADLDNYCTRFVDSLYSAKQLVTLIVHSSLINFDERLLNLKKLKTLRIGSKISLSSNNRSVIADQKTLDTIFNMKSLEFLYFDNVDFNGFAIPKIANTNIRELRFSSCVGLDVINLTDFSSNVGTRMSINNAPNTNIIGTAEFKNSQNKLIIN